MLYQHCSRTRELADSSNICYKVQHWPQRGPPYWLLLIFATRCSTNHNRGHQLRSVRVSCNACKWRQHAWGLICQTLKLNWTTYFQGKADNCPSDGGAEQRTKIFLRRFYQQTVHWCRRFKPGVGLEKLSNAKFLALQTPNTFVQSYENKLPLGLNFRCVVHD